MKRSFDTLKYRRGFSLAEVLMAVTIGSMVLVAMLTVYARAQATSAAIGRNLDKSRLPSEVLQLIAEDLDGITTSGTKVVIENKVINGYPGARLEISRTILNAKNTSMEFETIIWQTSYDYESDANGLVLYRMHTGMVQEDKLLDDQREDVEALYPFVPICEGVTHFSILVPQGKNVTNRWPGTKMPPGVVMTVSFSESFETGEGTFEILEEDKFIRTIAINRSRKMSFTIAKPTADEDELDDAKDEGDKGDEDKDRDGDSDDGKSEGPVESPENIRPGDRPQPGPSTSPSGSAAPAGGAKPDRRPRPSRRRDGR